MQRKIFQVAISHDAQMFAQRVMVQFEEKKKEIQHAIESMTEYNIRNINQEMDDAETQELIATELDNLGNALAKGFNGTKQQHLAKLAGTTTIWSFITQRSENYLRPDEKKVEIEKTLSTSQTNILPPLGNANSEEYNPNPQVKEEIREKKFTNIEENFRRLSDGIWKILTSRCAKVSFGIGLSTFCVAKFFLNLGSTNALIAGGLAGVATMIAYQGYMYLKNFKAY